MTHSFKLSRRIAGFRAPVLAALVIALAGCDSTNSLNPDSSTNPDGVEQSPAAEDPLADGGADVEVLAVDDPSLASAYSGGIPFGTANQPNSAFGDRYNGAFRNIWPQYLLSNLAAIKSRGGKVVLDFVGNQKNVKDADGHFSLSKWKKRIDWYRSVNFSSYINDGTIIGHFLLDEPNDKTNWNGTRVSGSTVEAMAKYSKQIWPGMVTLIRANPSYMDDFNVNYYYLNGAWAQYESWKGSASDYLRREVSAAQNKGLSLIVGLNMRHGGSNGSAMTASQIKSWGGTMLSSSYPCGFIGYRYDSDYLSRSDIKAAMYELRLKAKNRSFKSCR